MSVAFFTELEKYNCKICMKKQKSLNSQKSPEKEQQSWRHHPS